MLRFKRHKLFAFVLISFLLGLLSPRVAFVQEQFEGDFWNRGEHFQLDRKVVPVDEAYMIRTMML